MIVDDFIWLPQIVDKLDSKHAVYPEEVEELFFNQPQFRFHEKGNVQGENMYTALGQTDGGRYLIVFFIFKSPNRALIISARDMNRTERRYYGRK
ncbi:MAG: BrnT family toxin [Ardenticatenaceae bacterium]|nr:BrnT family toxin [Ardenticatenaceae bacterium]